MAWTAAEVEKAAGHTADAKTFADASAISASESEDFSKMSESHNTEEPESGKGKIPIIPCSGASSQRSI